MGKSRKVYALAVLALVLAAALVAASSALALPTYTQGSGSIPACHSCHPESGSATAPHDVAAHQTWVQTGPCSTCHNNGAPPNSPLPTACGGCHVSVPHILAEPTHTGLKCGTTPGCHGVQAAGPTVTAFTPASGVVGATLTLTGTGFTGATGVTVNGVAAVTFTVVSDTKITVKVPLGATSGTIAVTTPTGTGTSAASFTLLTTSKVSIKLVGVTAGAIKVNKVLTVKGAVTPGHSAKVTITLQRKVGTKWVKMKVLSPMSNATTGAYSAKYKVTKKGAWRAMSSAAKTAAYTSAKTAWKTFKVK